MRVLDYPCWNAFIPNQLLFESVSTTYMTGSIDYTNLLICVYGIRQSLDQNKLSKNDNINNNIVGVWQRVKVRDIEAKMSPTENTLLICAAESNNKLSSKPSCIKANFFPECLEAQPVVCIFYDPSELMLSYVLLASQSLTVATQTCNLVEKKKCYNADNRSLPKLTRTSEVKSVFDKSSKLVDTNEAKGVEQTNCRHKENCIAALLNNINSETFFSVKKSGTKSFIEIDGSRLKSRIKSILTAVFLASPLLLMHFICFIGRLISFGGKQTRFFCPWLPNIIQSPYIFRHVQNRAHQFGKVLKLSTTDAFERFILYNICCEQLVDTCLGFGIIFLVTQNGQAVHVATLTENWADDAASNLTDLVKWLMGAPAGLKLNAQLTKFLGHFFIYHIYLWSGYLSYLKLIMSPLIWYSSFVGVFGASAQLSLLQDVISMLTLHIYCFYVYAARIFSLQAYALCSLWRLFLGKKWNVLRSRVDSAPYNTDQLFVGTLIFTVLLFLLPTTALYYVVFTVLRLLVLIVKGFLQKIVYVINSMPVFTVFVKLFAPKWVAGCVRFEIENVREDSKTLVLSMQTCQISVQKLFSLTSKWMSSPSPPTHTWKECMYYLATGHLIYPWIVPDAAKKSQ